MPILTPWRRDSTVNRVQSSCGTSRTRLPRDHAGQSRCRIKRSWPEVMKMIGCSRPGQRLGLAVATRFRRADDPSFREKVAPILERRCLHCHGETTHKGKLSLSTAAAAFKGGDSGPAIVPGKPEESIAARHDRRRPARDAAERTSRSRSRKSPRSGPGSSVALTGRPAWLSRTGGSTVSDGGPSNRSTARESPRSPNRTGHARRSTHSSCPPSSGRGFRPAPRPTAAP